MDAHALARLTDFDFEQVVKDLLEIREGIPLELFASGADAGVDLRYMSHGDSVVVQCKHWIRGSRSKLRSHIEKKELPKVRKLAPSRYILATTVELTKHAKDDLVALLQPFTTVPGDVLGLADIVALLNANPHVVKRHLRLWLNSSAVLEALLNRASIARSQALVEELDASLRVYVPTTSFEEASRVLAAKRVCIIAGVPGIGKTTLAQVLAATYVAEAFDLVEVSEDVEELFQAWDDRRPQFFYYDDFLGRTTLRDRLHKNEDSRLLRALRQVAKSANKVMVLTTREYILQDAKQKFEKLDHADFAPLTCVVELAAYGTRERAEVLYNHLSVARITPTQRAYFAAQSVYVGIIAHKNFNPRLIALTLELGQWGDADPTAISDAIVANLNNPSRIWRHLMENELTIEELHLIEVLLSFGGDVEEAVLADQYSYSSAARGLTVDSRH